MRRRRLCASPAIKTLKVTSILLDHDFKSHIPSAYLNENPDCGVSLVWRSPLCSQVQKRLFHTDTQKIRTRIESNGFLKKTELNKAILEIKCERTVNSMYFVFSIR